MPSLLHNGVDVAPQFTHSRPSANTQRTHATRASRVIYYYNIIKYVRTREYDNKLDIILLHIGTVRVPRPKWGGHSHAQTSGRSRSNFLYVNQNENQKKSRFFGAICFSSISCSNPIHKCASVDDYQQH